MVWVEKLGEQPSWSMGNKENFYGVEEGYGDQRHHMVGYL